jgi:hypothetical protein
VFSNLTPMWLSLFATRRRLWASIAICAALSAVVIGASALALAGHVSTRVRHDAPASIDPSALTRAVGDLPVEQADSPI